MSQRIRRSDVGQGTLETVGIITIAAVLVAASVTAVVTQAPGVTETVRCAIARVIQPSKAPCDNEVADPGGDENGPGEGDDGGDGDRDGEPDDQPDEPILNPDDPDDPRCRDAMPTSGPLDPDQPTLIQVGCRALYVTEDCAEQWQAYTDAATGGARADRAEPLATCVADAYDHMEPTCTVSSNSEVDRSEVRILFIKIGNSDGMLVEELGDGRIRVHLLQGTEIGGEVSGSGKGVDFSVGGVTGYEDGTTYEFHNKEKAQEWLDWYQQYRNIDAHVGGLSQSGSNCAVVGQCSGVMNPHAQDQIDKLQKKEKELEKTEPEHHNLSESSVRTSKVTLSGGVEFPFSKDKGNGKGSVVPSISGDYTGEVQVEQRDWTDGSMSASYKSSDAGGFLVGVKAAGGKTKKKEKDGKEEKEDQGSASGGDALGAAWNGNSTTTVSWNSDDELDKLILTFDSQAMESINKAGIDLSVTLPYGFGMSGGYSRNEKEGTSSVTEMVLDFEQHPDLRKKLRPLIDEMFPRKDNGDLKKGDVDLNFDDSRDGSGEDDDVRTALDDNANVRDLDYDVKEVEESSSVGVDFAGVDLFESKWTHVESEKTLTGSSFEVTDVTGERQTIRPAPKCKDLPFERPDDYYTDEFSDPVQA